MTVGRQARAALPAATTTAAMLLVSFSPLAGIPVPRPPLFVALVIGLVAYRAIGHLRGHARLEPAEWWALACYMLFLAYVMLTVALRLHALPRDPMILPSLALYLPVMFLAFHAARTPAAVVAVVYLMAGTFVVAGLEGLATGTLIPDAYGLSIFPPADPNEPRATYQTEGLYLGSFLILSVWAACATRGLWTRLVFLGLSAVSVYLSLLIGSRSTFLASVLIATALLLRSAWRSGTAYLALLVSVVGILVLLSASRPELPHAEGFQTLVRLQDAVNGEAKGDDSTMRGYLFTTAINLFLMDGGTLAFGAGIGAYDRMVGLVQAPTTSGFAYPHNLILELLAEYGLVGTALYLGPMVPLLAARLARWPSGGRADDPFRTACLAEMGLFWLIGMGTGGLRLDWLVVFFSYVALALPPAGSRTTERRTPKWLQCRPSRAAFA